MIDIFKAYLAVKSTYKGGKGKNEVAPGRNLYKLSSNENLLGPSPKAVAAIKSHIDTLNEYSDYEGDRFREALGAFYGSELSSEQFVTTNSGVEALEMICRAFLDPGLESIVCNPCFGPYALFTKRCGGKVVDVPLREETYDLDVDGIIAAINDKTRLIFLANPNNPTGTHIPTETIGRLLDRIPPHVVVVYDEVYYQFVDAVDYKTGVDYVQAGHQLIGVNSFSKAYGLGGLRVGYIYSTPKIANYIRQLRRPFMLSTLTQEGAMAALTDDEHIDRTVNLIQSEKPRFYKVLDELGYKYWPTQANFILIKPEINDEKFTDLMLDEGVMVRPVSGFGAPDCVRVTIGTKEANDAFFEALRKITM